MGEQVEPSKRGITYLQRREGGLDMLNPRVFFDSMFLKVNFGDLDSNNSPLWVNSIRDWILPFAEPWMRGGSLRRGRLTRDFLPQYLDYGVRCLKKWSIDKSFIESKTRKDLYSRVCRTFYCLQLALPDCPTSSLQDSLRLLSGPRLPPKFCDIAWLSLQEKLFVRGNLKFLSV